MTDLNIEQARFNMIEQQVRPWDVLDQRVLDVMAATPRERFVPEQYRNVAFADVEIPINDGETMLPPRMDGRILQALDLKPTDRVLEIGTGAGYLTACLAHMAALAVTVDINEDLSRNARQLLAGLEIENVTFRVGDAADGWTADGTFDAIAVTGALPVLPEALKHQLNVGGRLFAVVGEAPAMQALLVTRVGAQDWSAEVLFETVLPVLHHAARPQPFVF